MALVQDFKLSSFDSWLKAFVVLSIYLFSFITFFFLCQKIFGLNFQFIESQQQYILYNGMHTAQCICGPKLESKKTQREKKINFLFSQNYMQYRIPSLGCQNNSIIALTINVGTYFVSNIPLKRNKSNNINNHNKSIIMENFNSNKSKQ